MPITPPMFSADVFSESRDNLLSRLIKWFTRSEISHVGLVFNLTGEWWQLLSDYGKRLPVDWINHTCVIEAGWRVKVSKFTDRISGTSSMRAYRYDGLTHEERRVIVRAALGFIGQRYGVRRLFVFAKDILTRTKSVRRMGLDVMVCSYLVAYPYSLLDIRFNRKRPRECTPEDIAREAELPGPFREIWREKQT